MHAITLNVVICIDEVGMFLGAVKAINTDEGFQVSSPQASDAIVDASSLLEWCACTSNKAQMTSFSQRLVHSLIQCLPDGKELEIGKMWTKFHTLRTSKYFFTLWSKFLAQSIKKGSPIFFQFITRHLFTQLIKKHHPVAHMDMPLEVVENLTYEEKNALRYAAGYVPRNLMSKVKNSGLVNTKSLSLCLVDIMEEDGDIGDESQDWLKAVDRGGLIGISTRMYNFMYAMELVVKSFLKQENLPRDIKNDLVCLIKGNNDVKRHWITLSAEWEPEDSEILFTMILDLWVKMRGFSYASQWMERHKQQTKKTVQKSKGLRKKISK